MARYQLCFKAGRPIRAGRRVSGRSMLRPYGMLVRQHVWAKKAGASLPAGRQAPALHRIAAGLRLECGGLPPLLRAR